MSSYVLSFSLTFFKLSSASLLEVFSLAGSVICSPPLSVDVSQPVKAVDPCRQVEMQIASK